MLHSCFYTELHRRRVSSTQLQHGAQEDNLICREGDLLICFARIISHDFHGALQTLSMDTNPHIELLHPQWGKLAHRLIPINLRPTHSSFNHLQQEALRHLLHFHHRVPRFFRVPTNCTSLTRQIFSPFSTFYPSTPASSTNHIGLQFTTRITSNSKYFGFATKGISTYMVIMGKTINTIVSQSTSRILKFYLCYNPFL